MYSLVKKGFSNVFSVTKGLSNVCSGDKGVQ